MKENPLGKENSYQSERSYSPDILFPIPRLENRTHLNVSKELPFMGWDRWNAYEFSYLNKIRKPEVVRLQIDIPCESLNIVESKSLKLYLNTYSSKQFENIEALQALLKKDVENLVEAEVYLSLADIEVLSEQGFTDINALATSLDNCSLSDSIVLEGADASLLSCSEASNNEWMDETVVSHLFRSLCPVTGQPDWASVVIRYKGQSIQHENLLRYLLSFRKHQGFHEDCVEKIFSDVLKVCKPEKLSVYAAFTRRGGIEINPFRSNFETVIPFGRFARQ